jgi:hypothetical protein
MIYNTMQDTVVAMLANEQGNGTECELELEVHELEWQTNGLQQTATGYGDKLATRYKTRYNGRLRRVYASCHSNVARMYIIINGKRRTIH